MNKLLTIIAAVFMLSGCRSYDYKVTAYDKEGKVVRVWIALGGDNQPYIRDGQLTFYNKETGNLVQTTLQTTVEVM